MYMYVYFNSDGSIHYNDLAPKKMNLCDIKYQEDNKYSADFKSSDFLFLLRAFDLPMNFIY